jgi:hypothetical protein
MATLAEDLDKSVLQKEAIISKPSELASFIKACGEVLLSNDSSDLSFISGVNSVAMHRAITLNARLEQDYGFRCISLDTAIRDKMNRVLSIEGRGGSRIIDLFKAIQPDIQAHTTDETKAGARLIR